MLPAALCAARTCCLFFLSQNRGGSHDYRRRRDEILFIDARPMGQMLNRVLEEMVQVLYKHHFVDFGPYQEGEFVGSELGLVPIPP